MTFVGFFKLNFWVACLLTMMIAMPFQKFLKCLLKNGLGQKPLTVDLGGSSILISPCENSIWTKMVTYSLPKPSYYHKVLMDNDII